MKISVVILLMLLLLTGCNTERIYETVSDVPVLQTAAQPRQMRFSLAQEPVMPVMETDGGKLYLCGDYDLMTQTMESGDLSASVYAVSGYLPEELTVIRTGSDGLDRYEFVWTSVTEEGQRIGRCTLLDDGAYHYALSATVDAELMEEYQEIWNGIFESFTLD